MSLLREIQDAAVSSDCDVSVLLRKCKILAMRLGNDDFKRWVDQELNGYDAQSELPAYRLLRVESKGVFSGFHGLAKNVPVPLSRLPKQFQELMQYSSFRQPISAYNVLVENKQLELSEPWPADFVSHFSGEFYENMNCVSAWKVIPYNCLAALIDTVKTRILNFVLEIEAEAPDAGESPPKSTPVPQEKISQVFNTFITGNVQNVASGGSNFKQKAINTNGVPLEIFDQLLDALAHSDTDKRTISDISGSVEEMKLAYGTKGFGDRYKAFMSILADHIQVFGPVVAPYLPLLAKLLT